MSSISLVKRLRLVSQLIASDDGSGLEAHLKEEPRLLDLRRGTKDYLIHSAAAYGGELVIKLLVRWGQNVDLINGNGETPLIVAATNGNMSAVETLVGLGAEPDQAVTKGFTPLMAACWRGQHEIARFLISRGADPTVSYDLGSTRITCPIAAQMGGNPALSREMSRIMVEGRQE